MWQHDLITPGMISASSTVADDSFSPGASQIAWECVNAPPGANKEMPNGVWPHAWAPARAAEGEWLQVTFADEVSVARLQVQGRYDGGHWGCVTKLKFMYSVDTEGDTFYESSVKGSSILEAPSNQSNAHVNTYTLDAPITGRRFRIVVAGWFNYPSLRFELYGPVEEKAI